MIFAAAAVFLFLATTAVFLFRRRTCSSSAAGLVSSPAPPPFPFFSLAPPPDFILSRAASVPLLLCAAAGNDNDLDAAAAGNDDSKQVLPHPPLLIFSLPILPIPDSTVRCVLVPRGTSTARYNLLDGSNPLLSVSGSGSLFVPLTSLSDAKWQLPVEELYISDCVANGKELSQLLSHLTKLSVLFIGNFKRITRLDVAVEQQQLRTLVSSTAIHIEHTQPAEQHEGIAEEAEVEDDGLLLLGSNLCRSLRELTIYDCKCLSLAAPHPLLNGHEPRGLQALGSLRTLGILRCPKFLSEYSLDSPCYPFPTSVQVLSFHGAVDMKHLSNLTFLTRLNIEDSENLKCKDLAQDQLSQLVIYRCPEFFVGWGLAQRSSKLQMLYTDDFEGVLVKPICSLLSSCLVKLVFHSNDEVESFTKKQEEALQLITSLQELRFRRCKKLQCLPAGLRRLTSLKRLRIDQCPAIQSLPKDGLPSSLQELDVTYCGSKDLIQQCRKLKGTIQKIILQHEDDQ